MHQFNWCIYSILPQAKIEHLALLFWPENRYRALLQKFFNLYQNTRRHIPQDCIICRHLYQKLSLVSFAVWTEKSHNISGELEALFGSKYCWPLIYMDSLSSCSLISGTLQKRVRMGQRVINRLVCIGKETSWDTPWNRFPIMQDLSNLLTLTKRYNFKINIAQCLCRTYCLQFVGIFGKSLWKICNYM